MAVANSFDVVVVGGGFAGSLLAGALARSGLTVLVAEKEPRFRDRIRGEGLLPWGRVDLKRLGAESVLAASGAVEIIGMDWYEDRVRSPLTRWTGASGEPLSTATFSHPRVQEATYEWAAVGGATVCRPMKVTSFSNDGIPTVEVAYNGRTETVNARLVVGADGKKSSTRRWTGGESKSDPEHHLFGGVAAKGVRTDDRDTDNVAGDTGAVVEWFAQSADTTRLYLMFTRETLHSTGVGHSFDALVEYMTEYMPEGAMDEVEQDGPYGFFPNSDTWATEIAGNDVVLIGDAAGSPDPTQGHGLAMACRDARELRDLLIADDNWTAAVQEYADRRARYFAVIRETDHWRNILDMRSGDEADRLRAGNKLAEQADPTLGGFGALEALGPDGLVADAATRAMYFGENLIAGTTH